MQMPLSDYADITVSQFFNKAEGYMERVTAMEEAEWMRTNYIIYALLNMNPYIKSTDKPKTFESFLNNNKPKRA